MNEQILMPPTFTLNEHPITVEEHFELFKLEAEDKDISREEREQVSLLMPLPSPNVMKSSEEEEEEDKELYQITESNRYIPYEEQVKPAMHRVKSLRSQDVTVRKNLLVFADKQNITRQSDRIIVGHHYGAGPEGELSEAFRPKRRPRSYLVACDFSQESLHAIEWTMGTMMRDGDQLHVVTVVNREDKPEGMKQSGVPCIRELDKVSERITNEAKKILDQMLLFDVALITYAFCGRVKDVLSQLITNLSLTMVVCGTNGRGKMKGLFMGSISTFLVQKSPVPVTVIKPQRKQKKVARKPIKTTGLCESVQSGPLAVDELGKK